MAGASALFGISKYGDKVIFGPRSGFREASDRKQKEALENHSITYLFTYLMLYQVTYQAAEVSTIFNFLFFIHFFCVFKSERDLRSCEVTILRLSL